MNRGETNCNFILDLHSLTMSKSFVTTVNEQKWQREREKKKFPLRTLTQTHAQRSKAGQMKASPALSEASARSFSVADASAYFIACSSWPLEEGKCLFQHLGMRGCRLHCDCLGPERRQAWPQSLAVKQHSTIAYLVSAALVEENVKIAHDGLKWNMRARWEHDTL